MAAQLRRYEVEEGGLERLVEWFPTIAAVRDQYGFTIEAAYADEENSEFVLRHSRLLSTATTNRLNEPLRSMVSTHLYPRCI